jgi:AraC family transcriptional regulator
MPLPLIDVESYVPRDITVVRRASWPGLFLQERRGSAGAVHYPGGVRQYIFYCFLKPVRAEAAWMDGNRRISYLAGEGRFTPANTPVSFRWTGNVQVLMLGFEPWFFEHAAALMGIKAALDPSVHGRKLDASHPASRVIQQLAQELDELAGARVVVENIARAAAVFLLREFCNPPAAKPIAAVPPAAVLKVVELMRLRLHESLKVEELADAAGLSHFHFARQFKTATGHPPHEYLMRLRVDRAQELIAEHGRDWTLTAIAQDCGFVDQSHMARHFKRVLGITPKQFSEARNAGK